MDAALTWLKRLQKTARLARIKRGEKRRGQYQVNDIETQIILLYWWMPFHADLGFAYWWATLPIYGEPAQKNHCCEWNDLFSQKLAVKFSSDEKRKGKKYKLSIFSSPRFSILPAKTIWGWNAISENISDLVLAVFLRHVYQSSWWVSILDIGSARRCPSFKAGYFLTAAFSARIPKSLTSLHEQWASNSSTSKVFSLFFF